MRTALAGLLLSLPIFCQILIHGGVWTYSRPARDFAPICISAPPDGTDLVLPPTVLKRELRKQIEQGDLKSKENINQ